MTTTAPVYIVDDDPSVREAVSTTCSWRLHCADTRASFPTGVDVEEFRNQQGAAPSVVLR